MLPNQRRVAGYAAITVALLVLLFVPVPFRGDSLLAKACIDCLHLPLFFALTCGVHMLCRLVISGGAKRVFGVTALVAGILAMGSELLQGSLGREPSFGDLINNVIGIAAALMLIFALRKRGAAAIGGVCAVFVAGVIVASIPVWSAVETMARQRDRLPVIGDFEREWELLLWIAQGDIGGDDTTITRERERGDGGYRLRVDTHGAEWAGVVLLADGSVWTGFQTLLFDIDVTGEAWDLGVRIDTEDGRRFRSGVALSSGKKSYRVPFASLMDGGSVLDDELSQVRRLVLHAGEVGREGTFFLDNVRLE